MNGASVVSAYVIGLVVMAVSLLLASLVTHFCLVEGAGRGNTRTAPRRACFWLFAVLTPLAVLAVCHLAVYADIRIPSRRAAYMTAMCVSAALSFVLQVALGFALSKTHLSQRLQSWF